MNKKELEKYIVSQLKYKSFSSIENALLLQGLDQKEIDATYYKILNPDKSGPLKIIIVSLLIIIILLLIGGLVFYIIYINPINPIEKKEVEKPQINMTYNITDKNSAETITPEILAYVLYEMGSFKLHDSITGKKPVIQVNIRDYNKNYNFYARKGQLPILTNESNIDLKIITTEKTILESLEAGEDFEKAGKILNNSFNNGDLKFEVISDEKTLLAKGYLNLVIDLTMVMGIGMNEISGGLSLSPYPEDSNNKYKILLIILVIALLTFLAIYYKRIPIYWSNLFKTKRNKKSRQR